MAVRIFFFRNIALCLARGHATKMHAHQALQITVGLNGPFELTSEEGGARRQPIMTDFACIPPECGHKVVADGVNLAYLFVDCTPVVYAKWRAEGGEHKPPDADILAGLRALIETPGASREAGQSLASRWCEQALPGLIHLKPADPRIVRTMDMIDADPVASQNYASLAAKVHLSPSRFANLFRAQMGLPVRKYILWRRLILALERLKHGDSITAAAHNAGFSDCAHLSRSFHHAYGTMPSNTELV